MKFPHPIPVSTLSEQLGATLLGDATIEATGINEIHQVEPGDVTFSDHPKYFEKSLRSAATVVILNENVEPPPGKCVLVCADPFAAFDGLVRRFRPGTRLAGPLGRGVEIDPSAIIEPGAVVADFVRIGKNTVVGANSFIGEHTTIGDDCRIGPNSTIGAEAFYFKKTPEGSFQKWACGGRALIADRVDIGPGCTVARGVTGDTVIGEGTKIDAQCHLGHEVKIGRNCLLAAQVGIAGNTVVGDGVVIFGQVGIAQNLTIGDGAVISAKSGVSKNLEGGRAYFGIPAEEIRVKQRELAALRQLPELLKKG